MNPSFQLPSWVMELELDPDQIAELCDLFTAARVDGWQRGLTCCVGADYADLVARDIAGTLFEDNAKLAAQRGISRATLSRIFCRCRRNLRMPLRQPNMGRAGRTPKTKLNSPELTA